MRTLLILLCLVTVSFSQNNTVILNGNSWIKYESSSKTVFLLGFFNGMELGCNLSSWGDDDIIQFEAAKNYSNNYKNYLKGVSLSQIIEGLDIFYSNFMNRKIKTYDAMWVVLRQIGGDDEESINNLILNLRKNDND